MKTYLVLCVLVVWALIPTAGYGQQGKMARDLEKFKRGSTPPSWQKTRKGCLPPYPDLWKVGNIGKVDSQMKILQILDENRMLIRVGDPRDTYHHPQSAYYRKLVTVMLSGLPTKNRTSGDRLYVKQVVEITKTVTYDTAFGSKTVLLLECNSKRIKEARAKLEADKEAVVEQKRVEKKRKAAFEAAKWRTWNVPDGTKVEMKYCGMIGGTVILTRRDGSKLKMLLSDLSVEDREWIAKRYK